MGRTKNVPQKKTVGLGNMSLSTVGDFIPIFRKKSRKATRKERIVYYNVPLAKTCYSYYLGDIEAGRTYNVFPEHYDSCKVHFSNNEETDDGDTSIILQLDEIFVIVQKNNSCVLKDFVQSKAFLFDLYVKDESVHFKVYLKSVPLEKFSSIVGRSLQAAFALFFGVQQDSIDCPNQSMLSNNDLNVLYQHLCEHRRFPNDVALSSEALHFLRPRLRPYQEDAVKWMIYRETTANDLNDGLHPLYQKVNLKSGEDVYFDKYNGWIEKETPLVQGKWKGGILADEMGLGKTVEVLALILSNPKEKWHINEDSDESLVITRQTKKRPIPIHIKDTGYTAKKIKVSEDMVKGKSKKSENYQALQAIYNKTLANYDTTRVPAKTEYRVQCICGSANEEDCIECTECGKNQHTSCLGWDNTLGPYKCPQCWEDADILPVKATLIVTPAALRKQWCREMETHLKRGLKVLFYEGHSATPIYPTKLKDYDIVITTYGTLQAELRLTETRQSPNLRNQRKYWPGGSPLVRVLWWRLCLDEAQTVETPGRFVSLMAKKIPACHRWAITGTPMAKGVSDIYGLIDYLQMEPYNNYDTWKFTLYNAYINGNTEPVYDFLSRILWRTTKNSVLDQINIPAQTHKLYHLEFSAVEKFFYNREHEVCAQTFLSIADKFDPDIPLEKMNKQDLKQLMAPLLSLRQACSNPNVVRGKGRYLSLKKDTSSMEDLLEALILKNRNDCEESLRLMVSAINGLAGIYLLLEEPDEAIRQYRKVLQLAARFSKDEKEGKLVIDKLPLIHAMYNLAEILEVHKPDEYTLRDGTLKEDCANLEKQYIEKFMKETASCQEACTMITLTVAKHETNLRLGYGQWYSDGFDWVSLNDFDQDLISRVEMAAANANVECNVRVETTRSLLRKTYNWHSELDEARNKLSTAIDRLYRLEDNGKLIVIAEGVVEQAMDCHLRPQPATRKKKCPVCAADVLLKNYENKLYTIKQRTKNYEEMSLLGSWKPRFEELLLKSLLALLKARNGDSLVANDGEIHVSLIEILKKEFKEIRKLWTLIEQQVCAQDELDICKVRLQVKTTGQEEQQQRRRKENAALKNLSYQLPATHENINLIRVHELQHHELNLQLEEQRYNARLEALLGTRNYLGTLRQQQFEGCTPDPCPVCHSPLVNTWAILSCAHSYCLDCFKRWLKNGSIVMQCCVCRSKQNLQEVAYIRSSGNRSRAGIENGCPEDYDDDDDVKVAGNYSRKVEDVVKLILRLRRNDPHGKVLLFSTWPSVLKYTKQALERNDVRVELAEVAGSFEERIESFKDPGKNVSVLLLPIRLGAKGLNLIEATHVILLEPLLDPADELQAIGRVHRIGQTKPTVVHKFLVKGTVEESLHNATSSNAVEWEKGHVTVGQLKGLFKGISLDDDTIVDEAPDVEAANENDVNPHSNE